MCLFCVWVCDCVCVCFKVFQIEWWHYRAKDMITIATSRDNALVRAVEYLLCGGLERDQQAQRIPSFIHYHLLFYSFFSLPCIWFVDALKKAMSNEQLPSRYNTNTHARTGTYSVSIFTRYWKLLDDKITTKAFRSFTQSTFTPPPEDGTSQTLLQFLIWPFTPLCCASSQQATYSSWADTNPLLPN